MHPARAERRVRLAHGGVLDIYARPLDLRRLLICLDEASTRLLADVAPPLPVAPGRPAREDDECRRYGTASLFLYYASLLGQRKRAKGGSCTTSLAGL